MEAVTFRFADAARRLGVEARRMGLAPPAFRSPPRLAGVDRTLRRRPDGGAVVAVVLRGRPWVAILADLIEGVVAANRLGGVAADRVRSGLWEAMAGSEAPVAA
ncbi:MAG: hypothetical protein ACRD0A_11210 [Acidimicrobiales bacterium]